MQGSRRRWLTVGVASLALMVAGTASVAARPGEGNDPSGFGFGGPFRQRLEMRDMLRGGWGGFVRTETTYQTDEGGFVTRRIDDGTLSAATDASLDYTLATGEAASVTLDADTEVVAFTSESVDFGRGFHRERLVGEEIPPPPNPRGQPDRRVGRLAGRRQLPRPARGGPAGGLDDDRQRHDRRHHPDSLPAAVG